MDNFDFEAFAEYWIKYKGLHKIHTDSLIIGKEIYICNFDTCKLYLIGEVPQDE